MKNNHIKKNDNVIVISGNDKGKKGKVLSVDHENGRVIVEGVNMATKHRKPRKQGDVGGIIHQEAAVSISNVMHILSTIKKLYTEEVAPALFKKFAYKSTMQIPKMDKIVINIGLGEAKDNPKAIDAALSDLSQITGQKPVVTKAKKSVANFKLRQGMSIGVKVTLRGEKMYEFIDRLFNVALPRVRDFRGINPNAFDGRGNYSLGIKEQLIFPEIEYDKIDKIRGMDIIFVTTAKTDEEGRELLTLLGAPFARS